MRYARKTTRLTRRAKTPRDVDLDYMDCTWGEVFDFAADCMVPDFEKATGTWFLDPARRAAGLQGMSRVARYANTVTLRRAAQ